VRSTRNRVERDLADEFRGRDSGSYKPRHFHTAWGRRSLDQRPERPHSGWQHHRVQGEFGGHLHLGGWRLL
ncbi:MAG: hypothetical protein AVDCRST_MAG55-933, partial [uncultured Rubrobacteraceae bacterium]